MNLQQLQIDYPDLKEIHIHYTGYGDSLDDLEKHLVFNHADTERVIHNNPLNEQLNNLFDYLLERSDHDGFWNGEGGEGTIVIDVISGHIHWEHAEFYTERTEFIHELDIFSALPKEGNEKS